MKKKTAVKAENMKRLRRRFDSSVKSDRIQMRRIAERYALSLPVESDVFYLEVWEPYDQNLLMPKVELQIVVNEQVIYEQIIIRFL